MILSPLIVVGLFFPFGARAGYTEALVVAKAQSSKGPARARRCTTRLSETTVAACPTPGRTGAPRPLSVLRPSVQRRVRAVHELYQPGS